MPANRYPRGCGHRLGVACVVLALSGCTGDIDGTYAIALTVESIELMEDGEVQTTGEGYVEYVMNVFTGPDHTVSFEFPEGGEDVALVLSGTMDGKDFDASAVAALNLTEDDCTLNVEGLFTFIGTLEGDYVRGDLAMTGTAEEFCGSETLNEATIETVASLEGYFIGNLSEKSGPEEGGSSWSAWRAMWGLW